METQILRPIFFLFTALDTPVFVVAFQVHKNDMPVFFILFSFVKRKKKRL